MKKKTIKVKATLNENGKIVINIYDIQKALFRVNNIKRIK